MPALPHLAQLPPELSSFVGRAAELRAITAALTAGKLVTLVGPGGCGKTRLAIRACRSQVEAGRYDAVWVGLDRETEPDQVVHRVAEAHGVLVPSGSDPVAALAHGLRDREGVIALDNCEHLLVAVAELATVLLARCPGMGLLATSRTPLGIPGEQVWRVSPLDLEDAITLLLDRAGRITGTGPTESDNLGARTSARSVCDRLDRLPLALELAAGWAGTLSIAQIADALREPYALLGSDPRGSGFRQQTLEESMRWSHDLLDDDERLLFRWLSVFEPGFSADAVTRLASVGGPARSLAVLRGLIDKSLVVADTTGTVARYRMLEVVRAYARARLEEAGEASRVRDAHLDTYVELVAAAAPLRDTDKDAWRACVGAEYANIRAAIEWGLSLDDPTRGRRLAAAMAWLWQLENRGTDGMRLLQLAVDRGVGERSPLQAEVLVALALVADTAVAGGAGYPAAATAAELAAEVGPAGVGRLARSLVAIGFIGSDFERTRALATEVRDEARRAGDGFSADSAEALIGLVHLWLDDYPAAIEHLEKSVEGLVARNDRGVASSALGWLALASAQSGQLDRAGDLAVRAVLTAEPLRDFHRTGSAGSVLAEIRLLQGRADDAAKALAAIDQVVAESGTRPFIPRYECTKAMIALDQGRPAEAVEWCRREGAWRDEPSDAMLLPATQLVLAQALMRLGESVAASQLLDGLAASMATDAQPVVRAGVLDARAVPLQETNPERALELHHEALQLRIGRGLILGCIDSLELIARVAALHGEAERAALLTGAVDRAREETGYHAAGLAPKDDRNALPETEWAAALDKGRAMNLQEAIAFATRSRGRRLRPNSGLQSLTPTERSVIELAVEGLSNPQIAARLFMSRGTVKTHLGHVYTKLEISNRTELARLWSEN